MALEFEVDIGQVLDAELSVLPLVSIDPLELNAEEIYFQSNPAWSSNFLSAKGFWQSLNIRIVNSF